MEEYIISALKQHLEELAALTPNLSKPVWNDQRMNCDQCQYNGQDIDTYPCAKCHTRN